MPSSCVVVKLVCLPTSNQSTRGLTPVCGVCLRPRRCYDTISTKPQPRAGGSPSAAGELSHYDNYLSGAEFYSKQPIRKSLLGPSLVYTNVLRLLKPRRDKQKSPGPTCSDVNAMFHLIACCICTCITSPVW